MLFNVKGIPQGWLMLALTLSHLVVEWALGRSRCELKHNGEGVTSLSSRLCGMKHNARAGELAFASTRSRVVVLANASSPAFAFARMRSRVVVLANASSPAFVFARTTPQGVVLAKARVGELVFQDRAPKVAKQGRERRWGGRFRKNEPPGWSCCRNKSGGGRGSGQCAGGGVYVSKTVDNERKWLAYLLALCMFFCACSRVFVLQPPIPFLPIPSPCSCGRCCC